LMLRVPESPTHTARITKLNQLTQTAESITLRFAVLPQFASHGCAAHASRACDGAPDAAIHTCAIHTWGASIRRLSMRARPVYIRCIVNNRKEVIQCLIVYRRMRRQP
jgi:hypothetical protein